MKSNYITDAEDQKRYIKLMTDGRTLMNEGMELENEYRDREHSKFISKYFKYQNNYSCPSKPNDYWFVYQKVLGLKPHGYFELFSFSKCAHGIVTIRAKSEENANMIERSTEITQKEFLKAWHKVTGHINAIGLE